MIPSKGKHDTTAATPTKARSSPAAPCGAASEIADLRAHAELQGRLMTDFVVAAVHDAAQRAIEQATTCNAHDSAALRGLTLAARS
jgi:hypothetical protein